MANSEHIEILKSGVTSWNEWRTQQEEDCRPDLKGVNLSGAQLNHVNFRNTDLRYSVLENANLYGANLRGACAWGIKARQVNLQLADLTVASFSDADLTAAKLDSARLLSTDLEGADMGGVGLNQAMLYMARLSRTNLQGADLQHARLTEADIDKANLSDCWVYGISAWNLKGAPLRQSNLIITPREEKAAISVDDIEVAQFIYTLLNNKRLRRVIETLTSKVVLILGRFTAERKPFLDAIRRDLAGQNYVPVLFDFDAPPTQSIDETVSLLASLARFVIADITDAKSVLQELRAIVPNRPSLPIQPILRHGQKEPGMFDFFQAFPWFLSTVYYDNLDSLLANLKELVIGPAEGKAQDRANRLERANEATGASFRCS